MQSEKLSAGQLCTQEYKSTPSSPPVHDVPDGHLSLHSVTQSGKTDAPVGHISMHDFKSPPGQPLGDGNGVVDDGEGEGGGVVSAVKVPLVTHPPHSSSRGEPTELFNQHSLLACTHE